MKRNKLPFYASKDVSTGEVGTVRNGMIGVSALGSCVAVIAWDRHTRLGGIAHVMLPGAAPPGVLQPTRYADDGIRQLLEELRRQGAGIDALTICLVGGGNVLERDDDTICRANIESIRQVLEREGLRVDASHLGGCVRRSCLLDAVGGRVTYSLGDSKDCLLWETDMQVTS